MMVTLVLERQLPLSEHWEQEFNLADAHYRQPCEFK